ncbi:MAG TPA: S1 RNA-binding domain-containing protein [Anaerolineae bacterium]|nr:S1 RNA-binding domain-containing protein [Anaerolineae bacterium]
MTSVEISPTAEPQVSEPVAVETAPAAAPAPKGRQKPKVQTLPRKKIVKVLSVGMEVTGKVKRVSEYGAFVDIGVGRDGLLHISELSTSRVRKVDDMIKEGDEINVWIKELDSEKNRISLTMVPPGTKTIRDLAVGELVTGSVQRLTSYGAFVDIGMERDAMLHVKEMGDGYVAKPEDVVKVGDEIEARISGVDARRGRVDLSLKGLRPAAASGGFSEDIEIQPIGAVAEADEDLPTLMELAFRQALDGEEDYQPPSRARKPKRRKGHDRYEQDDIITRTLRYRG